VTRLKAEADGKREPPRERGKPKAHSIAEVWSMPVPSAEAAAAPEHVQLGIDAL